MCNICDDMTGEEFETFVSDILSEIGFENINLTKTSWDQGVDIIATRDEIKYAIQCKRYSQPVGNKAVQEVFSGKAFYKCHVGIVVTNNYFTQSAIDLARENGIVLWDRDFIGNYSYLIKINNSFLSMLKNDVEITILCDQINSKILYDYMKTYSIKMINNYIESGDYNEYIKSMIDNIDGSLNFYNAILYKIDEYNVCCSYYCKLNKNFEKTEAYSRLNEVDKKSGSKSIYNIVEFLVYYSLKSISIVRNNAILGQVSEVDVFVSDMDSFKLSQDVNEVCSSYEVLLSENFFPIFTNNIFENT